MKFVIAKEEFSRLVSRAVNVVPTKPSIPIAGNILVEARNGMITLTATDLTVGVRCHAPAKVLEEGGTTLPGKTLGSLVRELTAHNVEVTTGSNEITEIVAGASRFKLNGMSRAEFPEFPEFSGATQIKFPREALHDALFRTAFAVSREDNRFMLMGVMAAYAGKTLTLVGTDGKRLAKTETTVEAEIPNEGTCIIPIKAVEEFLKATASGDPEAETQLSFFEDKVALQTVDGIVISKLLTGDYPDYNRVIPAAGDTTLSLHREELIALLRQISLFAANVSHSVRFSFGDGELNLSANTSNVGEGRVSMPVNYSGDRLDIAFNPSFFIDILRHCRGETVELELTDTFNPGKLRDPEAEGALYVLMPMRLNEE